MSLKQDLIAHIKEKRGQDVGEQDSLFELGLLDSMDLLELIAFIEERAGVRVPDTEVVPENFETIARIDALVVRLR
jgi:acyl carrier protein